MSDELINQQPGPTSEAVSGNTDAIDYEKKLKDLASLLAEAESVSRRLNATIAKSGEHLTNIEAKRNELQEVFNDISGKQVSITGILDSLNNYLSTIGQTQALVEQHKANIANTLSDITRQQGEASTVLARINQLEQVANTASTGAAAQQQAAVAACGEATQNQVASAAAAAAAQAAQQQAQETLRSITSVHESVQALESDVSSLSRNCASYNDLALEGSNAAQQAKDAAIQAQSKTEQAERLISEAGVRVAALEKQIQKRDQEYLQWDKKFKELQSQIEGLLPGATSAGLSSAFRQQKESYKGPKIAYASLFVLSAVALGIASYVKPEESNLKTAANPWIGLLADIIHKSPLFVPCLLIAYFAFRSFTTADKIEQDYAYKERIATTFEGFKQQFGEIKTQAGQESPISTLCSKLLGIIGQHPARFFDPKHTEELPSAHVAVKQLGSSGSPVAEAVDSVRAPVKALVQTMVTKPKETVNPATPEE